MGCCFDKQSIQHSFIQFGSYLAGPLGPEIRYWPDRTGRNLGIGQTEQTEIWVLTRPNRPKYGYWPDRKMGIRQIEQTKIAIGQTEGATQIFSRPLWTVAPDPPVRDPSRSGQYLSWVADFILGFEMLKSGLSGKQRLNTRKKWLSVFTKKESYDTCCVFFFFTHFAEGFFHLENTRSFLKPVSVFSFQLLVQLLKIILNDFIDFF